MESIITSFIAILCLIVVVFLGWVMLKYLTPEPSGLYNTDDSFIKIDKHLDVIEALRPDLKKDLDHIRFIIKRGDYELASSCLKIVIQKGMRV
jgi:hypothetical protein